MMTAYAIFPLASVELGVAVVSFYALIQRALQAWSAACSPDFLSVFACMYCVCTCDRCSSSPPHRALRKLHTQHCSMAYLPVHIYCRSLCHCCLFSAPLSYFVVFYGPVPLYRMIMYPGICVGAIDISL